MDSIPAPQTLLGPLPILRDFRSDSGKVPLLHRVHTAATKEEVLGLMEPLIGEWFQSKFKGLTEPQAYAVPIIHARKNVLVSSPTGSGKTLTAFLSIINELYAKQLRGELEDRIYCF